MRTFLLTKLAVPELFYLVKSKCSINFTVEIKTNCILEKIELKCFM